MSAFKLTERSVERLLAPDPSGKQVLYWDTELRGFGVLVSGTSSAKTYVVQRRLPNGIQRRMTIEATNGISLEKARAEAADKLHELRLGKDPKSAKRTMATLKQTLDDLLATRKTMRERSRTAYRDLIENYLSDWLEIRLCEITPEMVERRHASIQSEIAKREKLRRAEAEKRGSKSLQRDDHTAVRRTGNATANSTMVALRALWNFAAERDPSIPPTHPVRRLRRAWFPVHRRERRIGSDEFPVFYATVDALENRTGRDYLKLLLFTGLRRTEAASLRWSEIDLTEKIIRLPARKTKAGRKLDLPMTDIVYDLMVARRALGTDGEFVFASHSKSGHIKEPKFHLSIIAKATGIYVSAHDLRRTYAGVAEASDISVYALKALVNHSVGADVTGGYLGLGVERLREPAQRVANRMKALCKIDIGEDANVRRMRA